MVYPVKVYLDLLLDCTASNEISADLLAESRLLLLFTKRRSAFLEAMGSLRPAFKTIDVSELFHQGASHHSHATPAWVMPRFS
jgi:hypothetical protein